MQIKGEQQNLVVMFSFLLPAAPTNPTLTLEGPGYVASLGRPQQERLFEIDNMSMGFGFSLKISVQKTKNVVAVDISNHPLYLHTVDPKYWTCWTHQLIGSLSHYLQGFIHLRWLAGFQPSTVSLPNFPKSPWRHLDATDELFCSIIVTILEVSNPRSLKGTSCTTKKNGVGLSLACMTFLGRIFGDSS